MNQCRQRAPNANENEGEDNFERLEGHAQLHGQPPQWQLKNCFDKPQEKDATILSSGHDDPLKIRWFHLSKHRQYRFFFKYYTLLLPPNNRTDLLFLSILKMPPFTHSCAKMEIRKAGAIKRRYKGSKNIVCLLKLVLSIEESDLFLCQGIVSPSF